MSLLLLLEVLGETLNCTRQRNLSAVSTSPAPSCFERSTYLPAIGCRLAAAGTIFDYIRWLRDRVQGNLHASTRS